MMSPMVTGLAADGVPEAVTCRVLGSSQARLSPVEGQPGNGLGLGGCASGERCTGRLRRRSCVWVPCHRR